jgi:hypothetical protein
MVNKRFLPQTGKADAQGSLCKNATGLSGGPFKPPLHMMRSDQAALTPAPIGHDTPVPPSPQ